MSYDLPEQEKREFSQFLDQTANIHEAEYILCTEDGETKRHLSAEELWHTLEPVDKD